MHELDVAQRLLDQAIRVATDNDAGRIDALYVELGEATHIAADQLQFCIDALATETPAADAEVAVEPIAPVGECACGWSGQPDMLSETVPMAPSLRCPDCGSPLTLTSGRECRLQRIEIPS